MRDITPHLLASRNAGNGVATRVSDNEDGCIDAVTATQAAAVSFAAAAAS